MLHDSRFIFFGTPRFAAIVLHKLLDAGLVPAAVICNPDRPVGRKKIVTAPPVKLLIANRKSQIVADKIKILQPENLNAIGDLLRAIRPQFAIVAAYANIIPKEILAIPRLGTIGVHPSLLPKYRGASPIQSAILGGEEETGVTLYLMDEKMDRGSILRQVKSDMRQGEAYLELEERLAKTGGELLLETIPDFVAGKILPQPQDHTKATFTKKFTTNDGEVDLVKDDPEMIWRKIRALNPEPGVWTLTYPGYEGTRVKLLRSEYLNGKLIVREIQRDGKMPQEIR